MKEKTLNGFLLLIPFLLIRFLLLSILNNMFNPDCILIGGGTTETLKICLQTSIEEMKTRMLVAEEDLPQIYLDEESSTTMVKGASEMVFSKWMPI